MSDKQNVKNKRADSAQTGSSQVWRVVFLKELGELWIGGKALILLILFSILLGVMSFLLATNSELSLIPPKEMVFLMLQAGIAVGLFISLIIGADSISGERERATLEGLLLTPVSRRQIVFGKFLAAVSPWPAALVISIPYLAVLSPDGGILLQALLWGGLLGTLLVTAFTCLGILVSSWSNSNKTSLFVSLGIYLICLLPTQFPGAAQAGFMGQFIKRINPMESVNHFLEKVVVNNRTLEEMGTWLLAPVLFTVLIFGILFWYAAPGLCLEAGKASIIRFGWGRAAGMLIIASLMISLSTTPLIALQEEKPQAKQSQEEESQDEESSNEESPEEEPVNPEEASTAMVFQEKVSVDSELPLQISINMAFQKLKTGDKFDFKTIVAYSATEDESPNMIVAMNIINLDGDGDPVDPEDWSPERTQYIEPLTPGESAEQNWTINTILDGDYMIYMVLIPEPEDPEATTHPVVSSGIHLTVEAFARLNPGGVLPIALGMPGGLMLGMVFLRWRRRRGIDMNGSE